MMLPLSGAPWLERFPTHWQKRPIAACFEERGEKNTSAIAPTLLSLSYGRLKRKDLEAHDGLRPASYATYQMLYPGDVVLRLIDLQNDKRSIRVGQVEEPGIITSAYVGLDCAWWASKRYAYYLLLALDILKVFYGLGSGMRQSITFSDLGRVPVAVPSEHEQLAIASYLDVETARIDALIEEKDGLIALLGELRGSVVRERTSGTHILGPRIDTDNVFLPTIPSAWQMVPIGRYSRIGNGSTPLKDNKVFWEGGTYPWLNSAVVNHDDVHVGSEFVTEAALRKCHLPIVCAGSVLIALTGQGKTRGQVAMLRIEATINQHLAFIRLDPEKLDGEFVYWALTGQYQALRMVSDGQGGTKGALTCDELARFRIPLPTLSEQRVIAADLYREIRRIDDLIKHVNQEIDLLRELRSTTITDAVLGRIEVLSKVKGKQELEAACAH